MAKLSYKFILENSHTWIKCEEDAPKVKVVTGEIIEIDEKLVNKMRMYMAGFRQVDEEGATHDEQFDAVNAENEAKAKEEAEKAKNEAKKKAKEEEKNEEGNKVPEIVPPTVKWAKEEEKKEEEKTVETKVKNDGNADITINVQ